MTGPSVPVNEAARQAAVDELNVSVVQAEKSLDRAGTAHLSRSLFIRITVFRKMSKFEETREARRARYMRLAKDARKLAHAEWNSGSREACLVVADSWSQLARAEQALDRDDGA